MVYRGLNLVPLNVSRGGRTVAAVRKAQGRKVRAPHESECLLTAGRGDPTESATENKPPLAQVEGKDEKVR
jgi:hypothetical protein